MRHHKNSSGTADGEVLGVKALEFLAGEPVLLDRFLQLSGLEVARLRQAAATPGFSAGLLDFLLAHEPTLVEFASFAGLSPQEVARARAAMDTDRSRSAT